MRTKYLDREGIIRAKLAYNLILWSCLELLFSCTSTRTTSKNELSKNEISRLLNIPISKHDNITLYREAAFWLKTPHIDGGSTKSGIDCSFLAYIIYTNVYQRKIDRNASDIFKNNCNQISRNRLKEGDLVFFNTLKRSSNKITHVGIYLKNDLFIHTSTTKGVIVSSLNEEYFRKTWVCGGKVK
jgi:cell wall-associated NlpC family hydrolase